MRRCLANLMGWARAVVSGLNKPGGAGASRLAGGLATYTVLRTSHTINEMPTTTDVNRIKIGKVVRREWAAEHESKAKQGKATR